MPTRSGMCSRQCHSKNSRRPSARIPFQIATTPSPARLIPGLTLPQCRQGEGDMRLFLVLVALFASGFSYGQDKVSFRLNWYLGGLHVPFYYGKERGFYSAEGIDVTINEGRGSANTVQVVAAGSDTFGLADSSSVILTAAKGADVKSVMSLLNSTGFSVISLASSGIRAPKDLEGK